MKIKENSTMGHTEFKPIKAGKKVGVKFSVWQIKNPKFKIETTIWGNDAKDLQNKLQAFFN